MALVEIAITRLANVRITLSKATQKFRREYTTLRLLRL